MTIEKCKDFVKDGYGTWDDTSKPTTFANMYDFMKNQNNVVMNLARGIWQPATAYTVGAIIRSPNLPAGCVATCTAPGTSGGTEPKWTAYGTTVTDGACKWKVNYEGTNASASGGSGTADMSNYVEKSDYQEAITSLQNSINTKQDELTFDTTPTANSSNPVTSDGVKKAIDANVAKAIVDTTYSGGTLTFIHKDGSRSTANIGVTSGGTSGDTSHATRAGQDGDGNVITDTYYKKSDASVIHAALQDSINSKQDKLTFDSTPTAGSSNPVTSDGIKKAIADAISAITDGDNKSY